MSRPYHPLRKEDVDHKEQHHPSRHEDIRSNGHLDIRRIIGPDDAHDLGDYSGHAETEQHAGHDEFVAPSQVELEDCHVGDCADEEEDEEDATYGHVDAYSGDAAESGCLGCVGRSDGHHGLGLAFIVSVTAGSDSGSGGRGREVRVADLSGLEQGILHSCNTL